MRKHSIVMQCTFTVRMKRWWEEATDGFYSVKVESCSYDNNKGMTK